MMAFIPGNAHAYCFVSIKEMDVFGKQMGIDNHGLKVLSTTGGAFATPNTDSKETRSAIENLTGLKPCQAETALNMLGLPNIVVFKEMYQYLTHEEVVAILLHEEGHLFHKHMEGENLQTADVCGMKVMDSITNEIEADAYAASVVGKEVVRKALIKSVMMIVDLLKKVGKEVPIEDLLMDPAFRTRINALM